MFSTLNKADESPCQKGLLHPSTKWVTNMLFSLHVLRPLCLDGYYHTTLLEIKEKCKQLSCWLQRCSFFLLVKRTTDNLDSKRAAEATKAKASILLQQSFSSFNALVVLASFSRPLSRPLDVLSQPMVPLVVTRNVKPKQQNSIKLFAQFVMKGKMYLTLNVLDVLLWCVWLNLSWE